jgi:hypothetical protein
MTYKETTSPDRKFVDFGSFEHISSSTQSTKSSIIKATSVSDKGIAKIDVIDGESAEPSIFIHREEERISKIEFVCSCGKSTHLDMEYDGE